jgi:hypothetical protein
MATQPTPIHSAANLIGPAIGLASTVLTAVLGSGIFGKGRLAAQGSAVVKLLPMIPPLVGGVLAVVSAKAVAVASTPLVTPVVAGATPTDLLGNLLKPVDAAGNLIKSVLGTVGL